MKKVIQLLSLTCFFVFGVASQEVYHFTKGLAVMSPARYGREALYIDELASQLYTKTLKTPVEGAQFGVDEKGEPLLWQAIISDSVNRLFIRGQNRNIGFGRSGYIYLTYTSDIEKTALLNITGNNAVFCNGELHTGDPYRLGWVHIPIKLKKGLNEFYVRGLFITANLRFPGKRISLNTDDPTLPSIILDNDNKSLQAAVVIINTASRELKDLQLRSKLLGKETVPAASSI